VLTITLNGRKEKLNIGCRTFISLDVLLNILSAPDSAVTLNGTKISSNKIAGTIVNAGDSLIVSDLGQATQAASP